MRDAIPAGVSLGIEPTVEALLVEVGKHLDKGYGDVKMKIRPGWDVEPVTAVRERHPELAIRVDANGSYESLRDLPIFKELDELDLTMLEQPFGPDELMLHARLQERIRTPICIDESAISTGIIRAAISLGSCRAIAVKVPRLGGIGPAREIHDLAEAAGIAVVCGGMLEFGIGRAANVAISSLPGFRHAGDIAGSDHSFAEDLVEPPVLVVNGMIPVPLDRPGLGVTVDRDRLAKATVRQHTISRAD
jgi:o-succinylbenzoate synthase